MDDHAAVSEYHDEENVATLSDVQKTSPVKHTRLKTPTEIMLERKLKRPEEPAHIQPPNSGRPVSVSEEQNIELGKQLDAEANNEDEEVHRRRLQAQKQAEKMGNYFKVVEERFEYLEEEIRHLRAQLQSLPALPSKDVESPREQLQKDPFPTHADYLLDIMRVEEAEVFSTKPYVLQVVIGRTSRFIGRNIPSDQIEMTDDLQSRPLRVQVYSRPLLEVLQRITSTQLLASNQDTLVFLYPFKTIITFEPKIREYLMQLEKSHSPTELQGNEEFHKAYGAPMSKSSGTDSAPTTEKIDESVLLEHLRLFVRLLDEDLGPNVNLCREIEAGTLRTVSFAELGYLYHLGQEVVTADEQEQVYRVISYGTMHTARFETDASPANVPESVGSLMFAVQCMYIDFDGSEFGPVQLLITIPEYSGRRPVAELPVSPFQFHSNTENLRAHFYTRGCVFYDLVQSGTGAYRQYAGLTSEAPREEVCQSCE